MVIGYIVYISLIEFHQELIYFREICLKKLNQVKTFLPSFLGISPLFVLEICFYYYLLKPYFKVKVNEKGVGGSRKEKQIIIVVLT